MSYQAKGDGGTALAAVSMAVSYTDDDHRELLQSIVEVARAILDARASSIFLLDEASNELVFEAVAGEGASFLVGRRIPADHGIAGWVVASGEPMVVDDAATNAVFAREMAESTSYVPNTVIAVPLSHGDDVLGVIEVLDRTSHHGSTLDDVTLLEMFAHQAAVSLRVMRRNRAASRVLSREDTELVGVVSLVRALDGLHDRRRPAALALISALGDVLTDDDDDDVDAWRLSPAGGRS